MPGRKFTAGSSYRYGFNGKENDNEVKGEGNQQDYGLRIYDPRLGRFLSVDPLTDEYPFYTPYQFAGNDVIRNVDLDGAEPMPATTGKEVEGQSQGTSQTKLEAQPAAHGSAMVTRYQSWTYHEGGVNGSKAGWMKQEDYFENIMKPLAQADNDGNWTSTLDFAFSRKEFVNKDYVGMVESVGKFIKENPTYDSWDKYIPIWGSLQQARLDFSVGKLGAGSVNVLLGASDIFFVKALISAPLKSLTTTTMYRAMSLTEYEKLCLTNGLSSMQGKELFVSTKASYSRSYLQKQGYDVLIEFTVKKNVLSAMTKNGIIATHSNVSKFGLTGSMQRLASGQWMDFGKNLFKVEKGVLNVGLGYNPSIFNSSIKSFKKIQ